MNEVSVRDTRMRCIFHKARNKTPRRTPASQLPRLASWLAALTVCWAIAWVFSATSAGWMAVWLGKPPPLAFHPAHHWKLPLKKDDFSYIVDERLSIFPTPRLVVTLSNSVCEAESSFQRLVRSAHISITPVLLQIEQPAHCSIEDVKNIPNRESI